MVRKAYFTQATFSFLRELKDNNTKDWFQANQPRYQAAVRDPLLHFIQDFAKPLQKISPYITADSRPVGGSMFRIHRDIRFSKEKVPYKTNAGAHFRHEDGKNAHAPGYYLHLEPGNVFGGAGIWRPDAQALFRIRTAIIENPDEWKQAAAGKSQQSMCAHQGEALKRPPKGFDPQHPLVEDLKRKDYALSLSFSEKAACGDDFLESYVEFCKSTTPYMRFLCNALDLKY